MRIGLAGLLLLSLAGFAARGAPPAVSTPTRYRAALIIGNANYQSVGALRNPVNDARDLCDSFTAIGFHVTCAQDVASRAQFRSLVEDYIESLPPDAVSVVYYAGHGVQAGGENFLIPTAARLANQDALTQQAVSLSFLMRQLGGAESYLTFVILDACRDNPLAADGQLPAGLAPFTNIPDGTEVVYASAANEPAIDGTGRNGTFTKHLLAHLKEPGSVEDLFKQVSLGVQSETAALGHTQIPARYTNFSGQECFVRCTDLELMEQQRRDSEERIAGLQARVDRGDQGARKQLDDLRSNNERLEGEIRKKQKAEREAAERGKESFVPPAF